MAMSIVFDPFPDSTGVHLWVVVGDSGLPQQKFQIYLAIEVDLLFGLVGFVANLLGRLKIGHVVAVVLRIYENASTML